MAKKDPLKKVASMSDKDIDKRLKDIKKSPENLRFTVDFDEKNQDVITNRIENGKVVKQHHNFMKDHVVEAKRPKRSVSPTPAKEEVLREAPTAEDSVTREAEKVVENTEEPKKPGLMDGFKDALMHFGPQLGGMLIGGLMEGTEGAVAGGMQGAAARDSLTDTGIALNNVKQRQEALDFRKEAESNRREDEKNRLTIARGWVTPEGSAVLKNNAGQFFDASGNPVKNPVSLSLMENNIKANTKMAELAQKAKEGQKMEPKDIIDIKRYADGRMKDIRLQDVSTSASRIIELANMDVNDVGELEVRALNKGDEKEVIKFSDPTAAKDAALIINYMKLADPGSVVRESEFAMAKDLGPLGETLKNAWLSRTKGPMLTPELRKQLVEAALVQAKGVYDTASRIEEDTINSFRGTNVNPSIIRDPNLNTLRAVLGTSIEEERDKKLLNRLGN